MRNDGGLWSSNGYSLTYTACSECSLAHINTTLSQHVSRTRLKNFECSYFRSEHKLYCTRQQTMSAQCNHGDNCERCAATTAAAAVVATCTPPRGGVFSRAQRVRAPYAPLCSGRRAGCLNTATHLCAAIVVCNREARSKRTTHCE